MVGFRDFFVDSIHNDSTRSSYFPMGPRAETDAKTKTQNFKMMFRTRRRELRSGLLEDEEPGWLARFVIFPGTLTGSWWLEVWDLFVLTMILLLCYFEPYSFALYEMGSEPPRIVTINKLLTFTFTVDMVAQFFIAWPRSEDSLHKDLWESRPEVLARHYLGCLVPGRSRGGWFWFDLVAVLPCWVATFTAGDNMANPLLMLRILRIFQSTRLHRLTKFQEFVHSKTGYHAILLECVKFVVLTTLTCHWMACLWIMVEGRERHGFISYYTDAESWLSALIKTKGDTCDPDAQHDPFCMYLLSFYWATMTLTSVGYGDISPQNKVEYTLSIVCMAVVGYIWAYIVGKIVSILENLNPETMRFKHSLDQLNSLMKRRSLPKDLQVRMRHYMHETRHFAIMKTQRELVEKWLSNGLQREVASRSAEVSCLLKGVFWMRDLEDEAVLDIVRAMHPVAYGPAELISVREAMLLMQKGIAGVKGRVLARGDIWGQVDILLESMHLLDSAIPRTVSYVEVLVLRKRSLLDVCKAYPHADRRLRRAQIRTASARAFCRAAQKISLSKSKNSYKAVHMASKVSPRAGEDEKLSSFANPGMKRLLDAEKDRANGCGPQDLNRLLSMVVENQSSMDGRIQALGYEVKVLEEKIIQDSERYAQNSMVWRFAGSPFKSPRSQSADTSRDSTSSTSPMSFSSWANKTFVSRSKRAGVGSPREAQLQTGLIEPNA